MSTQEKIAAMKVIIKARKEELAQLEQQKRNEAVERRINYLSYRIAKGKHFLNSIKQEGVTA